MKRMAFTVAAAILALLVLAGGCAAVGERWRGKPKCGYNFYWQPGELFYVIAGVRCSAHSENIREVDFFTSEFYHENVNYPGLEQLWSEGGLWWHIKHPDMPKED